MNIVIVDIGMVKSVKQGTVYSAVVVKNHSISTFIVFVSNTLALYESSRRNCPVIGLYQHTDLVHPHLTIQSTSGLEPSPQNILAPNQRLIESHVKCGSAGLMQSQQCHYISVGLLRHIQTVLLLLVC